MPIRIYTDSAGREWMVWSVSPPGTHVPERRRIPDRRRALLSECEVNRRVIPDRRAPHGWLCFEAESERRCLQPAPPGWKHLSREQMEALCEQAVPVGGGC